MRREIRALFFVIVLFSSCSFAEHNDLKNMEKALMQHIKDNDKKNNIHTEVLVLKALSYEKVDDHERAKPDEVYLCKIYLSAKWSYMTGNRVYNTNDTLDCYFDENKVFRRIGNNYEKASDLEI